MEMRKLQSKLYEFNLFYLYKKLKFKKENPDLFKEIMQFDFKNVYELTYASRIILIWNGLTEVPICKNCGEFLNKNNPDIRKSVDKTKIKLGCSHKCATKLAWDLDRKKRFSESIKKAWTKGVYEETSKKVMEKRRIDPIWKENQRKAVSEWMKKNNPMRNKESYKKMVRSKREQFSKKELPDWYFKGNRSRPCYSIFPMPLWDKLSKELFKEELCLYGLKEKIIGRYYADFFAEKSLVLIEWNERHHKFQKEYDAHRKEYILKKLPNILYITLWKEDFYSKKGELMLEEAFEKIKEEVNLWKMKKS